MNISLTKKQQNYIENQVESGDFQNYSEVVRDALRLHKTYRHKVLDELRKEIQKGWDSPDSSRTVAAIIKEKQNSFDAKG